MTATSRGSAGIGSRQDFIDYAVDVLVVHHSVASPPTVPAEVRTHAWWAVPQAIPSRAGSVDTSSHSIIKHLPEKRISDLLCVLCRQELIVLLQTVLSPLMWALVKIFCSLSMTLATEMESHWSLTASEMPWYYIISKG